MHTQNDLIEKKLDNTLTAEEARRFDDLLRADPAFAQAYATQQGMVTSLREHYREDLHRQLEAGYQSYQQTRQWQRRYFGIAATLLIGLLGGWFWFSTDQSLYNQYYHPYEVPVYRSSSLPVNQATVYYNQEQYAEAVPLLKSLQQSEDHTAYWSLLLGNAYLQLDSTTQAIDQFERVAAQSSNNNYTQYGRWYLAISYLRDKNITATRETLQPIARQPGLFQQKARQLLEEL
ncbi:MAG: hypothetical protein WA958_04895 [Tunicatimonas sp.]